MRRIFLLEIISVFSSFFVLVHVSVAFVSIGLTNVLYRRIFVFLEINCDLNWLFIPKYDLLAAIRQFIISS